VKSSSHHLLSLINDILDISKIEAGQLNLYISSFKLPASLRKTFNIILPLAKSKNIEVELEISQEVQEVELDKRRIEQVFLNLLTNAIKFTEKGKINVSCFRQNHMILLSVTDTGIGIEEDKLSELFQPFHQLDSGLSRKREGTGLGLSISKKLITMMDGTIDVKSCPGKGSTFTLTFPHKMEV
nr:ATP-binding protein [Deltaproteobacteria bacterium]